MKKILLSTIVAATLVSAQEQLPYEISLTYGITNPESDFKLDDHKNYGIRFGINNQLILPSIFDTIEFIYERSNDVEYEQRKDLNLKADINRYSVNLLHTYNNFKTIAPYALIGLGYEDLKPTYKGFAANDSGTVNLGVGLKYKLDTNWNLRAEVRDQINYEKDVEHEIIYSFGVGYAFGKAVSSITNDEPKLQPKIDEDNDGVEDRLDKCLGTPNGIAVDTNGCPMDDDNDGVINEKDSCPNSPAGAKVNAQGCQLDSDGDGVYDAQDSCPTTPRGASVDASGCALDSDKDGVIDLNDKCPNTLEGFNVDNVGCAVNYNFKVQFDTDKSNVKDQYIPTLKNFVNFMNMKTNYKAQIQGFTDSIGAASYNLNLSTRRAKSVMNKLVELGIDANRLSYKGFGQENPIASNDTIEGRDANRRVEAKIEK